MIHVIFEVDASVVEKTLKEMNEGGIHSGGKFTITDDKEIAVTLEIK